jgi:hypothetical protein
MGIHNLQESSPPTKQSHERDLETRKIALVWFLPPFVFAACTVAMILSLPFFPSHDGPLHLYYVDVLRGVLTHSGPYPQYFAIKSHLTPYMVEYYSLMGLEQLFSPLMSEKLLICAYALTFIFGFRYLVRSMTRDSGPWTLAGALLCINLYIYMGFLSYALGTAISLWVMGFWIRWMKELTLLRLGILSAGFILVALTHPVPPAVFLIFACLYSVAIYLHGTTGMPGKPQRAALREFTRPMAVLAAMGIASGLWMLRFVGSLPEEHKHPFATTKVFIRFAKEVLLYRLEPPQVYKVTWVTFIAIVAITAIGVLSAIWEKREKADVVALLAVALALFFFILSFSVPEFINRSSFFGERFSIYWVVFLLSGAAAIKPPRWCTSAVGMIALVGAVSVLYAQGHYLSHTARNLNYALHVPLVKPGSLGVIIAEPRSAEYLDPSMWVAGHFFRESQAILTTAPWTRLKIILLRPKVIYPWTYEDVMEYVPGEILDTLNNKGTVQLDFFVCNGPSGPQTEELAKRLRFKVVSNTPQMGLYCRPEATRSGAERAGKL